MLCVLTGRDDAPPADTLPDPAGRHSLGPAVPLGLCQHVRGWGGVVVRHEVAVVRHEVAPQLFKVLHGDGQEELHAAEDVQQRLQRKHKRSAEEKPPVFLIMTVYSVTTAQWGELAVID